MENLVKTILSPKKIQNQLKILLKRNYSYRYRTCNAAVQRHLEKLKCGRRPPGTSTCETNTTEVDLNLQRERSKTEGTCDRIKLFPLRLICDKCPTVEKLLPNCKNIARIYCGALPEAPFCEKINSPYKSYSEYKASIKQPKKKLFIPQCDICPKSQHSLPGPPNPKAQCVNQSRTYDPCHRVFKNVK